MKTLKKRRKTKDEIQGKIQQMVRYYLNSDTRPIGKEELSQKFFGSDDPKTYRIVSSGYVPEVRRELEDKHGKTLFNIRGKGWQLTLGGEDTFKATQQAEKLMVAFKESYKRKSATFDYKKLPDSIKSLVRARDNLIDSLDKIIASQLELSDGIQKAITENSKAKEKKEDK